MNTTPTSTPFARRVGFGLLILASLLIGLSALRYGLPGQPFAPPMPNLLNQREWLVLHAVTGGLALVLGPWQFSTRLRARHPGLHRAVGWGYVLAILVGGIASLPLALGAEGGPVAQLGFALLGVIWLTTTAIALGHIKAHRIAEHRRWMLRSFVLTAAGITLRLQIGIGNAVEVPIDQYYTSLAWTSWLPQALLLEWWMKRGRSAHARHSSHASASL